MKFTATTDTGRVKSGFPVEFNDLKFEVGETPGRGGDFVSLSISDKGDPHHSLELSFAEVEQI